MAFPADPLGVRVRIAPGADLTAHPDTYPWQDATADWVPSRRLRHKRGSADEQAQGSSENNLVLRNSFSRVAGVEGMVARYSPDNPMSDLWPDFDLNCPMEIALDIGDGNGFQALSRAYLSDSPDEWPGQSERLAYVHARADGLFRRMGQWDKLADPVEFAIKAFADSAALDYWPMTDGAAATQWANAIGGGHPMRIVNPAGVDLAADNNIAGSSPLPVFKTSTNAHGLAEIRSYTDTTLQWTTTSMHRVGSSPSSITPLITVYQRNDFAHGIALDRGSSEVQLIQAQPGGTETVVASSSYTPADLEERSLLLYLTTSDAGGFALAEIYADDGTLLVSFGGPVIGSGYGTGHKIRIASPSVTDDVAGQLAYYPLDPGFDFTNLGDLADVLAAMRSYTGELLNDRIIRVGAQVGVAVQATPGLGPAMGPQPLNTRALDVFRECEETGHGILDDSLGVVAYRAFSELLNQDPVLTVDGSDRELFHPLKPTSDDLKVKTQVTVTQPDGTSATVRDQAAVARVGLYERRADANLASADQMRHLAGWLLYEGTRRDSRPRKRIPQLTLNLRSAPQLAAAALGLRLGDRIQIINPPPQLGPNPIDVMFVGWDTGSLHRRTWRLTANCVPYVHDVAVYGPYPYAAHQASGTNGSWNVTAPPGDLDGALLLLLHACDLGGIADMGTPTGGAPWQLLHEAEDMAAPGDGAARLWWKVAGDSEPASYGLTQLDDALTADGVAILAVVHGVDSSLLVSDFQASTSGSGSALTTPAVTMPAGGGLDLRFGALPSDANTFSAPAGFGLIAAGVVATPFVSAGFAARIVGAGDAGTGDFTLNASDTVGRFGATVLLPVPAGYSRYGHAGAQIAAGLWLTGNNGDYASCPHSASLGITGDIQVRAQLTLRPWPGTADTVASKWIATDDNRSWLLKLQSAGTLRFVWSEDGTEPLFTMADSTVPAIPPPSGELAVGVDLDVDNGSSQHVVTFYTAPTLAGPWTQLGDPVTLSGTTSIFAGTAPLEVGSILEGGAQVLTGLVDALELRDGIGGTIVANPDFGGQPAGTTSFSDTAGNTWTVHGDAQILGAFQAGTDNKLYVQTLAGPEFATDGRYYSLDLRVSGARIRVQSMGAPVGPVQEATVDVAPVNGVIKTIPARTAVTDWDQAIYGL